MRATDWVSVALLALAAPALAQGTLFSQRDFGGTRLTLAVKEPNMSFSARSIELQAGGWELCPRPFFGGACISVTESRPTLSLPRAFSGVVRSARPLEAATAAEPVARPLPERRAIPPAPRPAPASRTPEPTGEKSAEPEPD
jgi:hypothetical protein